MDYPDDETMQTLVALLDCRCVAAMESGELHAVMDAGNMEHVVLDDRCIAALVDRGWLDLQEVAGELLVGLTSGGRYHAERWHRLYERRRRKGVRA